MLGGNYKNRTFGFHHRHTEDDIWYHASPFAKTKRRGCFSTIPNAAEPPDVLSIVVTPFLWRSYLQLVRHAAHALLYLVTVRLNEGKSSEVPSPPPTCGDQRSHGMKELGEGTPSP